MNHAVAIAAPMLFQVLFVAGVVHATNGTGSFVGLGALLMALIAIPMTALFNWQIVRTGGERSSATTLRSIVLVTLAFPAVILVLYATAS